MTPRRIQKLKHKLQESRYRLNELHSDFVAPLQDMIFVATKDVYHMSTNGSCIYFDPNWLEHLIPASLDFILIHQLMHIELGHIDRPQYFKGDKFHLACDIVANAHLHEMGWAYDSLPRIGKIFCETFYPKHWGSELDAEQAMFCVPFDPAAEKPSGRKRYMIDSDIWWDRKSDRGESGTIVLTPGEDDPYSLPELYEGKEKNARPFRKGKESTEIIEEFTSPTTTNHGKNKKWDESSAAEISFLRAEQAAMSARSDSENSYGDNAAFLERLWQQPNQPTLDWRRLLNAFVQEEVFDYSFSPPDRRMQDSPFFLPDYCAELQTTTTPKEVLFMVDTSGSISEATLSVVYSELIGALQQFNGSLTGRLGFFDTVVYQPIPFSDIHDLQQIIPMGGGGTSYHCIFQYIRRFVNDPPSTLVIFTDGQCEFPEESEALGIPVLWLFTESDAAAPWGRSAYVGD